MAKRTVYLDHSATTPVDPRVLETMLPYFEKNYGNASSIHHMGREANVAVTGKNRSLSGCGTQGNYFYKRWYGKR